MTELNAIEGSIEPRKKTGYNNLFSWEKRENVPKN